MQNSIAVRSVPIALFAITIFLSAFLLFEVQPMVAKIILPWFGGSAAVWTTCLLFFQLVLLAGYIYADLTSRLLTPRAQGVVHATLLFAALLTLPIYPTASLIPAVGDGGTVAPEWRIALVLAASVGLPYFLLSTTGPLLQAWYARGEKQAVPYRLYALSNLGSMLALLGYPFLVEPQFALKAQTTGWSYGFAVFVLLCAALALFSMRQSATAAEADPARPAQVPAQAPAKSLYGLWMALAACASVLLLSFTSHLSQNIAPIPFLWVIPLVLYLLSFILCFEGRRWYWRGPYILLLAICLALVCVSVITGPSHPQIWRLISLYAATLFFACMVCHGELAALKPHPRYLTSFYLMLSLGGALGGVFVALVAPHLFLDNWELPLSMVGLVAMVLVVLFRDPESVMYHGRSWTLSIIGIAALVAVTGILGRSYYESFRDARVMVRDFYGWLKVEDSGSGMYAERMLTHGTITHGMQYLDPSRRRWPTTYYGRNCGAGLAVAELGRTDYLKVGVVGLGAGTFAAYGRKGDTFRFYDINPQVVTLAKTEFTYLQDSPANIEIAVGDARLSLTNEPPHGFDLIVLDAFSSDAIPVHLLTKEAFAVYFRQLSPRGVLAVHISNRYLDLKPVVKAAADFYGKEARQVDSEEIDYIGVYGSDWILVANDPKIFEAESLAVSAEKIEPTSIRMWTDDFSDLYQIRK
jgi:SAM-dependent methyltransferase